MIIIPYSDKYNEETINLILNILEGEFGLHDIDRPDLYKISETYQGNRSNFWIAIENEKVIGTIALSNYGNNRGYLKRMYVHKDFRGKGVADELFSTVIKFARENNYKEIFLATIEDMVAANKFYVKKSFKRINSLPADIPVFGDTIFYKMTL
jgi:N-acetylglutamate synthase-like GNAT family acetyltransferase